MFSLNDDQISELNKFKVLLDEHKMKEWFQKELDASKYFHSIFKKMDFEKRDLPKNELYSLCDKVVAIFGSTQLRIKGPRSTIESNNPKEFNDSLRKLYFSKTPIVKRFDDFLSNKRVGLSTASAFLCIPYHNEYPYFTNFMYEVFEYLNIDNSQHDEALEQAKKEFNINQNTSEPCEDYFKSLVILRDIKNSLNLESYFLVQNLLWNIYEQSRDDEDQVDSSETTSTEIGNSIPFGMESTLRDFLAGSPEVIEKGLSLIQTEYPTVVGPIDLLCKDKNNKYIVIEVKKTKDSDKAVGKILRYMGAIKDEMKSEPRGILIMYEKDTKVDYALKTLNNVKLKFYQVNFSLSDNPNNY